MRIAECGISDQRSFGTAMEYEGLLPGITGSGQGAKDEERSARGHSQDMVYACGSGHRIHFGYILLVVFISFQCFLRADIRPQKACARGVNLAKQKPTKPDVERFIDALHSHIPASQACA